VAVVSVSKAAAKIIAPMRNPLLVSLHLDMAGIRLKCVSKECGTGGLFVNQKANIRIVIISIC
jgi:hypothetical protein